MSFVMPGAFSDNAPTPMDDAQIVVEGSDFDKSPMAVLWFSGFVSDQLLETKKGELRELISASADWKLAGEVPTPRVLQYNGRAGLDVRGVLDVALLSKFARPPSPLSPRPFPSCLDPFTAPWKRRNEVAYAVEKR